MIRTITKLTPKLHGRRMSLAQFEPAISEDGRIYELSRGVVICMDVPAVRHMLQVDASRYQLDLYRKEMQGRIFSIAEGSGCKVLLVDFESERHPDLAVYLSPPPDEKDFWAYWIPDLVIEVVSQSSKTRDYVEKAEEYLSFGIKEYWIIDARKGQLTVLRRARGQWTKRLVKPPEMYETTLLPGFKFDCQAVFKAADTAPRSKGGDS